jgi:chromosome segregation ATPase
MIEWIMLFWSGFLAASLLALMLISVIHQRAVRITRRRLEDAIPASLIEMNADRDRLRAHFAISTRRLEMSVEQLRINATTHLGEIGRNAEIISRLKSQLARKTEVADQLAAKVGALTGEIEEAQRERERTLIDVVSLKLALTAKELELVQSATKQSLEIDTQRVKIAALETTIELYKLQASELQWKFPSKINEIENPTGRIADHGDSPRRPAPAAQKANRKAQIDGRRDLPAIVSGMDRRQDDRGNQAPEKRSASPPSPQEPSSSLNPPAQHRPPPNPKRRQRPPKPNHHLQ